MKNKIHKSKTPPPLQLVLFGGWDDGRVRRDWEHDGLLHDLPPRRRVLSLHQPHSLRISQWEFQKGDKKLELKELAVAPINKDKRHNGPEELSLWTILISLIQSNTLVLSQALMDCHFQWEISLQQITQQRWVGSPFGRPRCNFNSDEML